MDGAPQEPSRRRLARLAATSAKEPTALLSASNASTTPCAFDGYPDLQVYLGKGPSAEAESKTTTLVRPLLHHGPTVEVPLFYPASPARDGYCAIPVDEEPRIWCSHRTRHAPTTARSCR
ncbi:hypothetical protein [Streptomyces tropicalis]|uniref:Uncharacterized protein n=1 Tax=Streptomyces tropicalis TaxID=3034234 RepID=A0ABT6A6B0_9ACTN|nr:hypothetical protein [Streptomyces tropicalis]MDF3300174.1 hypothetical protein [Streptomyces tropicalis]